MPTLPFAALQAACATRGIDCAGAQLIHHSSNAVYVLPGSAAVARVSTKEASGHQAIRSSKVTRWLSETHQFGAMAPLPGVEPVQLDESTAVGFWVYYPQPSEKAAPTSRELGTLLRSLHALPAPPPIELDTWTPLESLHATLLDDDTASALDDPERSWLLDRIAEIRHEIADLEWALEPGLIHGDAWAGNLLWDTTTHPNRAILGDWDWVCIGPREVDLIPTWHASIRYGRDRGWVENFITAYGFDLTTWPGYDTLMEMRDLVQVSGPLRRARTSPAHAARLHQRVTDIRAGNRTAPWTSY
ncbi:phosphotransferase [Nocardia tengchongensis]|uniref:phosphotransferase n=1 Tax=Nocardia tengchongensis TaxID=2055889 RepID=UPI003699265A